MNKIGKLIAVLLVTILLIVNSPTDLVLAEGSRYDISATVEGASLNDADIYLADPADNFSVEFNISGVTSEEYNIGLYSSGGVACEASTTNRAIYNCEATANGPASIYYNLYVYGTEDYESYYEADYLYFFIGDDRSRSHSAVSLFQTDPSHRYIGRDGYIFGEKNAPLDYLSISPLPADPSDEFSQLVLEELKFTCSPAKNSLLENVRLFRNDYTNNTEILVSNGPAQIINGRQVFSFDITGNDRYITYGAEYIVRADIKQSTSAYAYNFDKTKSVNCGIRTEEDITAYDRYTGMNLNTENGLVLGNFGYANSEIEFRHPRALTWIDGPATTPGLGGPAIQVDEEFFIQTFLYRDDLKAIKDLQIIIDYGSKTASAGRFHWDKNSGTITQISGWGEEKIRLIQEASSITNFEGSGALIKFALKSTDKMRTGYGFTHTIHAFANYEYGSWPNWVEFGEPGFIAFTNASADFEEPYGRVLPEQPWEENYGSVRAEVNPSPVVIGQPTSTTFYVKTSSCINVNRLDYRNNYLVNGRGTMGSFYAGYDLKGQKIEGYYASTWGGDKVSFEGSEFSYNAETGECAVKFNWTPKAGFIVANNNAVAIYTRLFNPFTSELETSPAWTKLSSGVDTDNDGTFTTIR